MKFTVVDNQFKVCPKTKEFMCKAAKQHEYLVERVWPYLDACIYSFIPFIIIIVLNSFIIKNINKARKKRNIMSSHFSTQDQEVMVNLSTNQASRGKQKKVEKLYLKPITPTSEILTLGRSTSHTVKRERHESNFRLSCMLICISLSFLFMTMPVNVRLIFQNLYNSYYQLNNKNTTKKSLTHSITEILMYLNHSTNFFLYCATGKKFREELKRMLSCCVSKFPCAKKKIKYPQKMIRKTQLSMPSTPTATLHSHIPLVDMSFH